MLNSIFPTEKLTREIKDFHSCPMENLNINIITKIEVKGMEAQEMYDIIKNKPKHYIQYKIPKKGGGFRYINAPTQRLKEIQTKILNDILYKVPVDKHAHGFIDNRSIYTNAACHVGSECVVNLDLKDFFDTITKERVIKELDRFVSTPLTIAELITFNDKLPQGTPTSPYMSNIVAVKLDRKLGGLAKKHKAIYTRYADDITFSSKTNKDLHKIIPKAHSCIKKEGFTLNYKKIQVMRRGGRQVVTGLVVNDKLNVPRKKSRNFRAEIHQTRLTGDEEDFHILAKLRGYNGFITGANREKGKQNLKKIGELMK